MALSSYSTLQTAISTWLARSDLSSVVADFITLAEAKFKREPRLQYVAQRSLTVSGDTTLPTDFKSLIALYGDTDTLRGPIELVPPEKLAEAKMMYGTSGAPFAVAVMGNTLTFAPSPDATYTLTMLYEGQITALSATETSNWLLLNHPDVYLYGALVEAEPYLKNDPRIATWKGLLEEAIEGVYSASQRKRYGGRMVIRPRRAIG